MYITTVFNSPIFEITYITVHLKCFSNRSLGSLPQIILLVLSPSLISRYNACIQGFFSSTIRLLYHVFISKCTNHVFILYFIFFCILLQTFNFNFNNYSIFYFILYSAPKHDPLQQLLVIYLNFSTFFGFLDPSSAPSCVTNTFNDV